jgi:hypothetical protein
VRIAVAIVGYHKVVDILRCRESLERSTHDDGRQAYSELIAGGSG